MTPLSHPRRAFCVRAGSLMAATLAARPVWSAAPQQHALLIGVCDYPHYPSIRLDGPANDIPRLRTLLATRGYDDIVTLADRGIDDAATPTRKNILRAFDAMEKRLAPGDRLLLYFAGHGAVQAPATPRQGLHVEPYDEVWLPADAGPLSLDLTIQNAVVDDEIGVFVSRCRARGAMVWVVVDACHGGGALRDGQIANGARLRGLSFRDLQLTRSLESWLQRVMRRPRQTRLGQLQSCAAVPVPSTAGDLLAFFACNSNSLTPELPLLRTEAGVRYTGLFSHILITEMARLSASTRAPGTFGELIAGMEGAYEKWARHGWIPQFCGHADEPLMKRRLFQS